MQKNLLLVVILFFSAYSLECMRVYYFINKTDQLLYYALSDNKCEFVTQCPKNTRTFSELHPQQKIKIAFLDIDDLHVSLTGSDFVMQEPCLGKKCVIFKNKDNRFAIKYSGQKKNVW